MIRTLTFAGCVAAGLAFAPGSALAHTDADLVAVAAGEEAEVTLKPTHGCAGSPTIQVAVRAPVQAATPGDVAGWSVTAEPDGNGNTVLRWTGGSLPADTTGAFPVTFTAPDTVGALLTFPSVQYCANGDELAWISGDPASEFPAPRLLVLPAGSDEAATIDDVPSDAPGREQLVQVVDIDNPLAAITLPPATTTPTPTTAPATTTAATTIPITPSPPATTTTPSAPATTVASTGSPTSTSTSTVAAVTATTGVASVGDDDGSDTGVVVGIIATVAVVGIVGAGIVVVRRRRS